MTTEFAPIIECLPIEAPKIETLIPIQEPAPITTPFPFGIIGCLCIGTFMSSYPCRLSDMYTLSAVITFSSNIILSKAAISLK